MAHIKYTKHFLEYNKQFKRELNETEVKWKRLYVCFGLKMQMKGDNIFRETKQWALSPEVWVT